MTVEVRDDNAQRITAVTMTVTDETVMMKVARAMASRACAGPLGNLYTVKNDSSK